VKRTLVLDVVGLTCDMITDATPHLARLRANGLTPLETVLPAVTCSVQATLTTGLLPREHGAVGNGWYFRDLAEVWLWRQSSHLVSGERIWDAAKKRDPSFSVAKLFWWFNMYSTADFAVTPRPLYPADGRKIPDIYTEPAGLRDELNRRLGPFPLFHFWGPNADLVSSRWIADATKIVFDEKKPSLTLVYLPHLDYPLQRLGPDHPRIRQELAAIDAIAGELIEHATARGARVLVLSEYGIESVTGAVHVNRALRDAKLLRVREELGTEKLDAGGSEAFAVADHQVAHVYVRDRARIGEVKDLLARLDGVEQVLDDEGKRAVGLDHPRSGELVLVAGRGRWFSYYFWLDDARAPDYARTVDIHRKPGYDPVELFIDPTLKLPALRVGLRLAQKMLGFRYLMDVIPLDASLVKGSHGRLDPDPNRWPVLLSTEASLLPPGGAHATQVKDIVLKHAFE
jgi:predicted AlkP superfamily pyrophosphatase or phosphodiesterase